MVEFVLLFSFACILKLLTYIIQSSETSRHSDSRFPFGVFNSSEFVSYIPEVQTSGPNATDSKPCKET